MTSPRYSTPFFGRADVDERGFHARQHVLHAAEIDVAVDRQRVVGRHRDVVLHQRAAFEHRDVRDAVVALVHDHEVPAGRPALAVRTAAPGERLAVERLEQRGAVDVDAAERRARVDVPAADPLRRRVAGCAADGGLSVRSAPPPVLLRPRPPRRRRRFFGPSSVPSPPAARGPAGAAGRVSPTCGLAGRIRRGARGSRGGCGRPRPMPAPASPASSRACSPMSSAVSPRSASAAVQSSLPVHGSARRPRATARGWPLPPAAPRCPASCGRVRRASRAGAASSAGRRGRGRPGAARRRSRRRSRRRFVAGARPRRQPAAQRLRRSGAALARRSVPGRLRAAAAWVIRSVPRLRGVPVRTSMPSLMTRAPPAHAGACRLPAVPTACRRARSIGGFAVPGPRRVLP